MGYNLLEYKIPDIIKFFGILVVYTVYMAWWASHIQTEVDTTISVIKTHVQLDNHPIYQTQAILSISRVQETQVKILQEMISDHARCKAILELMNKRVEKIEAVEQKEHRN